MDDRNRVEQLLVMRDGVRLATDVYLPKSLKTVPTVLVRLPSGKRDRYVFLARCAPFFTGRGYAFVVQDVRGTGASEGDALPYVFEVHDAYDTLEWVVGQEWSDGSVGMFGDSYYGYTQWAALASRHPALKALVPRMASVLMPVGEVEDPAQVYVTPTDAGPGLPAAGDGFDRPASLGWAMALATVWSGTGNEELEVDLATQPPLRAFDDAFERAGYRSKAFDCTIPEHHPEPIFPDGHPFEARPVAILHTLGWFDPVAKRGIAAYDYLSKRPGWAPLQFLTADSVDHENYHLDQVPLSRAKDHGENEAALASFLPHYVGEALDFFDMHLASRVARDIPRVRWHLAHVGYQTSDSWPPPGAVEEALYLTDFAGARGKPGDLSDSMAGGLLATDPSQRNESVTWRHDPDDPVPGGASPLSVIFDYADESATSDRDDVLVFDSDPRTEPLDLAGPVIVDLTVNAASGELDLFVHLLDVAPDGRAHRLLGDQVTVNIRGGARAIELQLGHLGYRIRPGHRLRLHIASSECPHFLVHPGIAGANRWTATLRHTVEHTLESDQSQPSKIRLTVLSESPRMSSE